MSRADGYAAASLDILQKNAALDAIMRDAELSATVQALHNYRTLLGNSQAASTSRQGQLHDQIRTLGHRIYLFVDTMAKQERRMLETAVQESQWFLLISLRIIGLAKYFVGRQLKRVAVAPLKQLEMRLMSIAKGHSNHLGSPSPDREFMAFTDAFNRMLRELEIRRKRMLQSEKLASLGILTSGVAHELNNPLSNISSSCQLRRTAGGVVGQ